MLSPSKSLSPNSHVFMNPEALTTPSCWVFMEASLHRCDSPTHWPLMIDSTTIPSSLTRHQEVGLKVTTLSSWLVLLATSPPSLDRSKHHLINITKDTYFTLCLLGNSKSFWSLTKNKCIFIILHHNITVAVWGPYDVENVTPKFPLLGRPLGVDSVCFAT